MEKEIIHKSATFSHKNSNPLEKKSSKEIYTSLIKSAPLVAGDISPLVPLEDIPWIDDSLIKHGLLFYCTHLTQFLFAGLSTFMLGLPVKHITAVVVKGQMGDPDQHSARFMSTLKLIAEFFRFYFNPEKAYKTYAYVRKRHNLARNLYIRNESRQIRPGEKGEFSEKWKQDLSIAVSKDLQHIDTSSAPSELNCWKPEVPVSQLDVVLTQFMYIWMFWGFPKLYGIKNRAEELKGVIHLWAIYGRMIGIQDEYNVCLKPDYELYDLLTRNFLVESLKTMDEAAVTVSSALIEGMQKRMPFITYKSVLYINLRELQDCEGENLWKIMSWWDKFCFRFLQGWMWIARQGILFRFMLDIPTLIWLLYQYRSLIFSTLKGYFAPLKTSVYKRFGFGNS